MSILFTQYLRPNGQQVQVTIDSTPMIEGRAEFFIKAGGHFDCEQLTTGEVSFTAMYNDKTIAHEVCTNDEAVRTVVASIVNSAYKWAQERRDKGTSIHSFKPKHVPGS